jgi:hypothetical protein
MMKPGRYNVATRNFVDYCPSVVLALAAPSETTASPLEDFSAWAKGVVARYHDAKRAQSERHDPEWLQQFLARPKTKGALLAIACRVRMRGAPGVLDKDDRMALLRVARAVVCEALCVVFASHAELEAWHADRVRRLMPLLGTRRRQSVVRALRTCAQWFDALRGLDFELCGADGAPLVPTADLPHLRRAAEALASGAPALDFGGELGAYEAGTPGPKNFLYVRCLRVASDLIRTMTGSPMDREVEMLLAEAFGHPRQDRVVGFARRRQRAGKLSTDHEDIAAWMENVRQRTRAASAADARRRERRERFAEVNLRELIEA